MAEAPIRDEGVSPPRAVTDVTDSSLKQSPQQATMPSDYEASKIQTSNVITPDDVPTASCDLESEIKPTTESSPVQEENLKETDSYSPGGINTFGLQPREHPIPRVRNSDSFVSDLVSLSSESDHEDDMDFSQSEEDKPTETTSQEDQLEVTANAEEETTNISVDTTSEGDTSDEWLKVDHVMQTSEVVDIPTTGGTNTQRQPEEGSHVSSSKTVEVLATSDYRDDTLMLHPISQSITSLEDDETEKFGNSESTTAGAGTFADLYVTTAVDSSRDIPPDTPSSGDLPQPLAGEHPTTVAHEGGATTTADGSSVHSGSPDLASGRRVSVEGEDSERGKSGRLSPYLMISKTGNVAKVTEFESPGLLYAKANKSVHNRDLLQPADEVAEDVLEAYQGESKGDEQEEGQSGELDIEDGANTVSYEVGLEAGTAPIDPQILNDLEIRAQLVAANLSQVMDNLRNSLHAMSVCSKQSVQLHRESVDNLHTVVDANVKAMYVFMAKYEELHKSLGPLQQIASQIQEVDEKLKVLERNFRTP